MLGKLFKYEWRSISKLLLPIHGFVLLFALLSRFYFTISGGTDALLNTDSTIIGTLTMLLIFALVIVISSIAIFTYIYSGYHFHKNVFTDQGYLTNTLPVTPSQLLLSKELAALLWLLIDVVVISISIFILVGSTELFSNFSIFWSTLIRYASQTPLFTTLIIIALVLSPFLAIGILFFQYHTWKSCLQPQNTCFHWGICWNLCCSADIWINPACSLGILRQHYNYAGEYLQQ